MTNKKFTLEDLKLESFLTEMDDAKLMKLQGGDGISPMNPSLVNSGNCPSCDCPTATADSFACTSSEGSDCDTSHFTNFTEYYTCGKLCVD